LRPPRQNQDFAGVSRSEFTEIVPAPNLLDFIIFIQKQVLHLVPEGKTSRVCPSMHFLKISSSIVDLIDFLGLLSLCRVFSRYDSLLKASQSSIRHRVKAIIAKWFEIDWIGQSGDRRIKDVDEQSPARFQVAP
jgi:hypothetical protein